MTQQPLFSAAFFVHACACNSNDQQQSTHTHDEFSATTETNGTTEYTPWPSEHSDTNRVQPQSAVGPAAAVGVNDKPLRRPTAMLYAPAIVNSRKHLLFLRVALIYLFWHLCHYYYISTWRLPWLGEGLDRAALRSRWIKAWYCLSISSALFFSATTLCSSTSFLALF